MWKTTASSSHEEENVKKECQRKCDAGRQDWGLEQAHDCCSDKVRLPWNPFELELRLIQEKERLNVSELKTPELECYTFISGLFLRRGDDTPDFSQATSLGKCYPKFTRRAWGLYAVYGASKE